MIQRQRSHANMTIKMTVATVLAFSLVAVAGGGIGPTHYSEVELIGSASTIGELDGNLWEIRLEIDRVVMVVYCKPLNPCSFLDNNTIQATGSFESPFGV